MIWIFVFQLYNANFRYDSILRVCVRMSFFLSNRRCTKNIQSVIENTKTICSLFFAKRFRNAWENVEYDIWNKRAPSTLNTKKTIFNDLMNVHCETIHVCIENFAPKSRVMESNGSFDPGRVTTINNVKEILSFFAALVTRTHNNMNVNCVAYFFHVRFDTIMLYFIIIIETIDKACIAIHTHMANLSKNVHFSQNMCKMFQATSKRKKRAKNTIKTD